MDDALIEEKFGKFYTRLENLKGKVDRIHQAVFGNGIKGHETRVSDLEEKWNKRHETCPLMRQHADRRTQRQIVVGLWIQGLMMAAGFLAMFLRG